MSWEITIPDAGGVGQGTTRVVEGAHWIEAIARFLEELGAGRLAEDASCDIQPQGILRISDPSTGVTYVIRDLGASGASAKRTTPARPLPTGGPRATPGGAIPAAVVGAGSLGPGSLPRMRPASQTAPAGPAGALGAGSPVPVRGPTAQAVPRGAVLGVARTSAARAVSEPAVDPFGRTQAGVHLDARAAGPSRPAAAPPTPAAARPGAVAPPAAGPARGARPRLQGAEAIQILEGRVGELDNPRLNAEQVIDVALDLAWQHIGCEGAHVLLPTRRPDSMRVVSARSETPTDSSGFRMQIDQAVTALVGESQVALRLADLALVVHYDRVGGDVCDLRIRTLAWTPIRHKGRLLAALALFNSGRPEGFLPEEAQALDVLAAALARQLVKHL